MKPVLIFILSLFGLLFSGCSISSTKPYEQDTFFQLWTEALKNPTLFTKNTPTENGHIRFIVYPNDAQVFSNASLLAIESLTNKAWNLPFSTRVNSISNFQRMKVEGDDLIVYSSLEGASTLSAIDRAELQKFVLNESFLVNRLYLPKSEVAVVEVNFNVSQANAQTRIPVIVEKSIQMKRAIESQLPVKLQLAGDYMHTLLKSSKTIRLLLTSNHENGIYSPDYLLQLDALSQWLKERPEIENVVSISDLLKKFRILFNDFDREWYEATNNRNQQYLLLYELSMPYGLGIEYLCDHDKSSAIITLTISDQALGRSSIIKKNIAEWLTLNAKEIKLEAVN